MCVCLLPHMSQVGKEVAGDAGLMSFQAPLRSQACLPSHPNRFQGFTLQPMLPFNLTLLTQPP